MRSLSDKYHNLISGLRGFRDVVFYAALTIELLLMIYERCDLPLSTPSYVFRVSFLLTLVVILMTEYSQKQWIVIAVSVAFCFFCYRVTGNNYLLRLAVFLAACKDIDPAKALRYIFAVTGIGYAAIFLLSVFGIYGGRYVASEFGREVGEEIRYCFGFGHPNTLHGAFFALAVLSVYVIREFEAKMKAAWYAALFVLNLLLYHITDSRTAMLGTMLLLLASLASFLPEKVKSGRCLYVLGTMLFLFCVAISVFAAWISPFVHEKGSIYKKVDKALTGRIWSLYYNTRDHKGSLMTWTLFGDSNSGESFFDMGWVRMFYWYGIIPAIIVILLILFFIYNTYRRRDIEALIMLCTLSVYTIVEAGFVSSYIGRDFMLVLAGAYLYNYRTKRLTA